MEKEICYLCSEGNTIKKEGKNQGQPFYVHSFLLGNEAFKLFEFKNNDGVFPIQNYLVQNQVERLNVLKGSFYVYVRDGNLAVSLVSIERVI